MRFLCPFLQPAQVPLDGSTVPLVYNHSSWLGTVHKLAEGALFPITQVMNEDIQQHRPGWYTTADRSPQPKQLSTFPIHLQQLVGDATGDGAEHPTESFTPGSGRTAACPACHARADWIPMVRETS